jgi:hypothetical protein
MSKTLVLYVFHIYNESVKYFIDNAIFYDPNIDFIVISNGKSNHFEVPSYVKKFFRDNKGYDFGGWSDALLTDNLYEYYDNFIFVNSSVIGPYLKPSFKGKWTDIFLGGLKGDVKLFGCLINANQNSTIKATINLVLDKKKVILEELINKYLWKNLLDNKNGPHIQSYTFCMNKETLQYLIECGIFSKKYINSFMETVFKKEKLMSEKILEKGWNIGCLFPLYKDIDFRDMNKYNLKFLADISNNFYENDLWTKEQLVFVKCNRGSNIEIYHVVIVVILIVILVFVFIKLFRRYVYFKSK